MPCCLLLEAPMGLVCNHGAHQHWTWQTQNPSSTSDYEHMHLMTLDGTAHVFNK
jgi:hypothetical protein